MVAGMTRRPIQDCVFPWQWLVVNARGGARPCCHTPVEFGNINNQSMDEIWNGPLMRRLRASISDGYVDPVCKNAACHYVKDMERLFGQDAYYRLELDKEYRFSLGGRTEICSSGWSYPELWGIWSDGEKATLALEFREKPASDFELSALCRGSGREGYPYPSPSVQLQINGRKLARWDFDHPSPTAEFSWRSVTIPTSVVRGSKLEVCLLIDRPLCPSILGWSSDSRRLGIGIAAIKLSQASHAAPNFVRLHSIFDTLKGSFAKTRGPVT
jgi:hypothetical protein